MFGKAIVFIVAHCPAADEMYLTDAFSKVLLSDLFLKYRERFPVIMGFIFDSKVSLLAGCYILLHLLK